MIKEINPNLQIDLAAEMLKNAENILIIFHLAPDGDAIGSAFGLCRALQKIGKSVRVDCSDKIPEKYSYLFSKLDQHDFKPEFIVSVDLASTNLFGEKLIKYANLVDLCIDHHISNTNYAKLSIIDEKAAATCEIIADLINKLEVETDGFIANCLYTGIATDTGCFRFSNTTPKTLRCAANMIEKGADSAYINKALFETNTRARLEIERAAMNTLEFDSSDRIAMIYITLEMCKKAGVEESDLEGIPSFPVKIEGVLAGITIKEKSTGIYKISVRTNNGLNASDICFNLGGGGHRAAAGCQIEGSLDDAKAAIVESVRKALIEYDERNSLYR